ncbi:hypothetical protein P0082_01055 [Candidatus Haliotispira prima]|uniref:Uncharacterized protein n=1 Tax=Candidatus Haliotispira prima TaxID=3034016 RepID=A0ABY8MHI9_9SPIO|nr:hypothetical protein P0082_01055 [Candidatus Haliotispira prima]
MTEEEFHLAELREKRKTQTIVLIIDAVIKIVWATVIAVFIFEGLPVLAGKETKFVVDISMAVSFAFGLGGVGYGWKQKRSKKKIEETNNRTMANQKQQIAELEKKLAGLEQEK